MPFCEKCGGQITEEMKFCDKCGAPVAAENTSEAQPVVQEAESADTMVNNSAPAENYVPSFGIKERLKGVANVLVSYLPQNLKNPGDKTLHWIGFGSIAALALTYVICFFIYMNEMCFPIGMGASFEGESLAGFFGADGANAVWMIIYFVLNLFPVYFAFKAFKYESCKKSAIIALAVSFILTVFSLIVWGICDFYDIDSMNSMAWYFLNDSLSAAWYLKFVLPIISFLGFGLDYVINNKN